MFLSGVRGIGSNSSLVDGLKEEFLPPAFLFLCRSIILLEAEVSLEQKLFGTLSAEIFIDQLV